MVLSEEYWFGMKFTKPELLALKFNCVQDNADRISDFLLYDYEDLNMLYGILKSIKELYNPDQIAIIIAP